MALVYNLNKLKGRSFTLGLINLENKEIANNDLYIENLLQNIKNYCDVFFYDKTFYVNETDLLKIIDKNKNIFKEIEDLSLFKPINVKEDKLERINNDNDIVKFINKKNSDIKHNNEKGVQTLISKHGDNIENLKNLENYNKIASLDFEYIEPNIQGIREIGYVIWDKKNNDFKSEYIIIEDYYKKEATTKTESVRLEKMNDVANNIKPKILDLTSALKKTYKDLESCDCLIGHHLKTELKILQTRFNEVDKIDSQYTFSILNKEAKFSSVEDMLSKLNIKHKKLHNAYNDSYYTFLAIKEMHKIVNNTKEENKKRFRSVI